LDGIYRLVLALTCERSLCSFSFFMRSVFAQLKAFASCLHGCFCDIFFYILWYTSIFQTRWLCSILFYLLFFSRLALGICRRN